VVSSFHTTQRNHLQVCSYCKSRMKQCCTIKGLPSIVGRNNYQAYFKNWSQHLVRLLKALRRWLVIFLEFTIFNLFVIVLIGMQTRYLHFPGFWNFLTLAKFTRLKTTVALLRVKHFLNLYLWDRSQILKHVERFVRSQQNSWSVYCAEKLSRTLKNGSRNAQPCTLELQVKFYMNTTGWLDCRQCDA